MPESTPKLPPLTLAEWADETQGGDAGSYQDYLRSIPVGALPSPAGAAAVVEQAGRATTADGKLIMSVAEWADATQGGDAGSYSDYVTNAGASKKIVTSLPIATPYEDLLRDVLASGVHKTDRTGTGTTSVFGRQLRYNLAGGFPLITTKSVHFKSVALELLWFLRGDSNVRWLQERGVKIWDEWADENGDLGPVYGVQWRSWPTADGGSIDQITDVIEAIRTTPDSRRLMVSAWNPAEVPNMALPPCHALFQFYVADGKLSCQLYQRSADLFLGVPFNIASYALLTQMIAAQTGLELGEFVWTGGDCHIYDNHVEQVAEQLSRTPFAAPTLTLAERDSIFDYEYDDITVENYVHHPAIRGAVAV